MSRRFWLAAPLAVKSYETVRRWVIHFEPMIAADLRKCRPKPRTTWHLDAVYLKIAGRMIYLWRPPWMPRAKCLMILRIGL